ncbi:hypothetical protein AMTR_s00024p00230480 [Amborella trichopoda]|uniref:Uncharacterized protein n=1 Tax=Amborella trichopoda TaxID=13333 RepID=W1PML1_AMBTC|nr:hypothetical protein AMTR_s00024p00230480 [Amborella trichopoda]
MGHKIWLKARPQLGPPRPKDHVEPLQGENRASRGEPPCFPFSFSPSSSLSGPAQPLSKVGQGLGKDSSDLVRVGPGHGVGQCRSFASPKFEAYIEPFIPDARVGASHLNASEVSLRVLELSSHFCIQCAAPNMRE